MEINFYGLVWALAFIGIFLVIRKHLKKIGKENLAYSGVICLFAGILIGARLIYAFYYSPGVFLEKPLEILYLWKGGLSFHGGLFGGILASIFFCKSNKLNLRQFGDALALPMLFFLAIGKIANFLNAESYGTLAQVLWCVNFSGVIGCRHPSQIYEFFAYAALFIFLLAIKNKKIVDEDGCFFLVMLSGYSFLRFALDFLRDYQWSLGGIGAGQYLNLVTFIFSIIYLRKIKLQTREDFKKTST